MEQDNLLAKDKIGIGTKTWLCVAELEETVTTTPFFQAVKDFYVASTRKILKQFPFGDTLLKDLSILQPDSAPFFSVEKLLSLAKHFPQVGLADSRSLDKLREEFQDFQLSPADFL